MMHLGNGDIENSTSTRSTFQVSHS